MIDRNDAPEGTKAYAYQGVHQYSCAQCHFCGVVCPRRNEDNMCVARNRYDDTAVVFMTKEEHKAAKESLHDRI